MHLRSITLKGFKSFPDRTRLEFSPGVSVVVGPNGSGKSNITDAVLWAMGEQSPLAVRGQSMQDVIFAGAHGVQARGEAEVEVVLDNEGGAIDLEAGEISILRKLNRAGEGEYRINGARCRLTDVLELLSDTGLGKEMHSVVSQGRVEAIVTSKARDRRMLIEEAAGLGKHRKRRRRAQLKLARTQDNLDRALDVEREARTRLRPLKRQAEAAELHERLERQTDEALWALAREDVRVAEAAVSEAAAAVAEARAAAEETEAELRAVAARREAAEEALASRGEEREALANRFYAARSAHERIGLREESARQAAAGLADRGERRRALLGFARGGGRGRRGRRRVVRADRGARGRAGRAGLGSPGASGARGRRARGPPGRGRRAKVAALEGGSRGGRRGAVRGRRCRGVVPPRAARGRDGRRRRTPRLGPHGRRAGEARTSSCGRTPAPRAAPRPWPTTSTPIPATSSPSPPPSARASEPRSPPTSPREPRCSTARAPTAEPR